MRPTVKAIIPYFSFASILFSQSGKNGNGCILVPYGDLLIIWEMGW